MIITLAALRGLETAPRVLLALVATAVALTAAAPVQASTPTGPATPSFLAQGAGMGARPSTAVRRVQRVLQHRGYDLGAPGVDGRFGPITNAAVRQLQQDRGLAADGVVGPHTRKALGLDAGYRPATARPRQHHHTKTGAQDEGGAGPAPAATTPSLPGAAASTRDDRTDLEWGVLLLLVGFGALLAYAAVRAAHPREDRAVDPPTLGSARPDPEAPAPPQGPGARGESPTTVETGAPGDAPPARRGAAMLGYVTLGADAPADQADDAARELAASAAAGGWDLLDVVMDREGGYGLARRGLRYALRQVAEGKARGLLIPHLRALNPSMSDLGALLEWFRDADAIVVAFDLGLDTSTAVGQQSAQTLITLGAWERERIAARTPSRPAAGAWSELAQRIARMRASGMTLEAIADQLNAERVPTLQDASRWRPASVQAALAASRPAPPSPREQLPPLGDAMR